MGKGKKTTSLGNALVRSRFSKSSKEIDGADKWLHTSDLNDGSDWNKLNLKSVTEQNSLDDFLTTAELAGKDFESERLNLRFIKPELSVMSSEDAKKIKEAQEQNLDLLRIPRRPVWKGTDYDAKTLQMKERESFLIWRRKFAGAQENEQLSMTPFEKNLDFWRQLWRVIERSDVIVQIVDARNPLLFFCADLEQYVKEIDQNKLNLLLINKSDLLTDRQRLEWLRYFKKVNIHVAFWSAAIANEESTLQKIEEYEKNMSQTDRTRLDSEMTTASSANNEDSEAGEEHDEEEEEEEDDEDESENENDKSQNLNKFGLLQDEEEEVEDEEGSKDETESESESELEESDSETEEEEELEKVQEQTKADVTDSTVQLPVQSEKKVKEYKEEKCETELQIEEMEKKLKDLNITDEEREQCKILNGIELVSLFKTIHKHIPDKAKAGITTIGLVGYPNVGKSSTLNALLKTKKCAVSETPGKTKHYQTIYLDEDLLLCDCPGLVFPSFVSTRGELILNGILPIDQMKDYVEPINLALHHIPKTVVEMIYGIQIPKPKEGQDQNRVPNAEELCGTYSFFRGYMNHKGTPDVQRGARYILKDYVNGKLLYCYPPPGVDSVLFQDHRYETSKEVKYLEKVAKIEKRLKEKKAQLTNFDKDFFANLEPKALLKGGIVGYHRRQKAIQRGAEVSWAAGGQAGAQPVPAPTDKPWKKHFNSHKKGKLRCKTTHFDQANY